MASASPTGRGRCGGASPSMRSSCRSATSRASTSSPSCRAAWIWAVRPLVGAQARCPAAPVRAGRRRGPPPMRRDARRHQRAPPRRAGGPPVLSRPRSASILSCRITSGRPPSRSRSAGGQAMQHLLGGVGQDHRGLSTRLGNARGPKAKTSPWRRCRRPTRPLQKRFQNPGFTMASCSVAARPSSRAKTSVATPAIICTLGCRMRPCRSLIDARRREERPPTGEAECQITARGQRPVCLPVGLAELCRAFHNRRRGRCLHAPPRVPAPSTPNRAPRAARPAPRGRSR